MLYGADVCPPLGLPCSHYQQSTHIHTIVTIVIMVHAGGQVAPDTLDHLNRRTLPPATVVTTPLLHWSLLLDK